MQIERLLHNNTGISEQEEADLLKAANALFTETLVSPQNRHLSL